MAVRELHAEHRGLTSLSRRGLPDIDDGRELQHLDAVLIAIGRFGAAGATNICYVAVAVDYGDMVGSDSGQTCKQVLTFVHEDWWSQPDFVDCQK